MLRRVRKEAMTLLQTLSEFHDDDKQCLDHCGFGVESWVSLQVRLKELIKSTGVNGL
jgi:hypothetical protein